MRAWLAVLVGVACACVFSVRGQDTKDIDAPFAYLDKKEPWLHKVTMGPSAWICGSYKGGETWEAYDLIDEYVNTRNVKKLNLRRTTWPSIRTVPMTALAEKDEKKSSVCHYIERDLHCDVPKPMDSRLFAVNKKPMEKFYMKGFWGQANDKRIDHYVQMMIQKMTQLKITDADKSFYTVAYFDDNLKGVMFKIIG